MINFSILIPHKNTPDLLQRCLDSIPEREDIQIVIVDDNSDADKVDFNAFPGLTRKNTEVYFTKEGKGAGYARNVGLRYAKGKWLLFADADDFFTANAFESICNELNSPCDIIYFKVDSCDSDTLKPADRDKTYNMLTTDYYRNRTQESEERLRYYHTVPWGKMLKRNLVVKNDIQFDEVIGSNDVMFLLLAGYYAAQIDVSDFAIYCVTEKKGSLTHIRSKEMLTSRYVVRLRCNQFLRTHGKKQYRDPIVAFHLVRAITQYGLKQFFKFIRLAVIYKENPFIGGKWLIKLIISKCFKNKKYYRT